MHGFSGKEASDGIFVRAIRVFGIFCGGGGNVVYRWTDIPLSARALAAALALPSANGYEEEKVISLNNRRWLDNRRLFF